MLERGEKRAGRFGIHMVFRGNGREINRHPQRMKGAYWQEDTNLLPMRGRGRETVILKSLRARSGKFPPRLTAQFLSSLVTSVLMAFRLR